MLVSSEKTFRVDQFDFDPNIRGFSADASELGLGVGDWPEQVRLVSAEGLESTFEIRTPMVFHGDLAGFRYTNGSTLQVKIFND